MGKIMVCWRSGLYHLEVAVSDLELKNSLQAGRPKYVASIYHTRLRKQGDTFLSEWNKLREMDSVLAGLQWIYWHLDVTANWRTQQRPTAYIHTQFSTSSCLSQSFGLDTNISSLLTRASKLEPPYPPKLLELTQKSTCQLKPYSSSCKPVASKMHVCLTLYHVCKYLLSNSLTCSFTGYWFAQVLENRMGADPTCLSWSWTTGQTIGRLWVWDWMVNTVTVLSNFLRCEWVNQRRGILVGVREHPEVKVKDRDNIKTEEPTLLNY